MGLVMQEQEMFKKLIDIAGTIVLDREAEIKLAVVCLLAGGHLLIEDSPGVGKTTLVKTLGKLLGLETKRVQFTVDLLPSDILGGHIFNPQTQKFVFYPGPIFSQMFVADELNRTSPRTQSALLQAMEESYVSIEGQDMELPSPFFVIATQNPQTQSGTFALPESQLDRFLMSLELPYSSKETEERLFRFQEPKNKINSLQALLSKEDLLGAQQAVEKVKVSEAVAGYVSALLEASRSNIIDRALPLSTRAGIALVRAARAWAYLEGRDYLRPEDIQVVAISVLGHRLGGSHGVKQGRQWAQELLQKTAV